MNEIVEKLAAEMIAYHDRLRTIVEGLTDENVVDLIVECRREARPTESHNFSMPEWDLIADQLESELRLRRLFRRAKEHEEKTGSTYYCMRCDGDCKPEHLAEINAEPD
ncbi:MAG TPA: hypothetical protein VGY54_25205 [Polyangiaceae bacterium]|nr:hypothetical protein [Polyangiaceae bacterium]